MYKDLAKKILGSLLPPPEAKTKEGLLPADADLRAALKKVVTFDDLLDALRALEFVTSARIALLMSAYRWTVPLDKQSDGSKAVRAHAQVLYQAYQLVAAATRPALAAGLPATAGEPAAVATAKADFHRLEPRITIDVGPGHPGTAKFLGAVRDVLLLCLAVGTRGPAGQQLLAMMAGDPRVRIVIDLRTKRGMSSLLAYVPDGTIESYAQPVAAATGVVKPADRGAGTYTFLGAPVWIDGDADIVENADALFPKLITVDRALEQILFGSLSFSDNKYAFYTPVRIELMHEMLHAAHNGEGVNRAAVKLPAGVAAEIWTNTEEYVTIAGGDLTENDFGAEIGLPDRYGHSGLLLELLPSTSEAASDSLATLSRIP